MSEEERVQVCFLWDDRVDGDCGKCMDRVSLSTLIGLDSSNRKFEFLREFFCRYQAAIKTAEECLGKVLRQKLMVIAKLNRFMVQTRFNIGLCCDF